MIRCGTLFFGTNGNERAMCGRFNLRTSVEELTQLFLLEGSVPLNQPERYNIAPTQQILAIRRSEPGAPRKASLLRWGLVPSWAKDAAIGNRMINARSETVHEKNAFKAALRARRCLIPATGYYEWKQEKEGGKQPYLIELRDQSLFAFAGLWERNTKVADEPLETCTILTRGATGELRDLHDRMPVILPASDWDRWLDPAFADAGALGELAAQSEPAMESRPVNRFVNNARHEGPQCVAPPD